MLYSCHHAYASLKLSYFWGRCRWHTAGLSTPVQIARRKALSACFADPVLWKMLLSSGKQLCENVDTEFYAHCLSVIPVQMCSIYNSRFSSSTARLSKFILRSEIQAGLLIPSFFPSILPSILISVFHFTV